MNRIQEIEESIKRLATRALWTGAVIGLLFGFAIGFAVGYGQTGTTVVVPLKQGIKV